MADPKEPLATDSELAKDQDLAPETETVQFNSDEDGSDEDDDDE